MQAGVYQHYKGGYYQLIGIAEHTETGELLVVYVSLSGVDLPGPRMRVRPLGGPEGWSTPVDLPGKPMYPRFFYIGDRIR